MSNVCAAAGDVAMSEGSAAVTVASRGGSLVQELTFEQQLEKITARSQNCITRYGDGQPLMVLDHTIVTNLNDLALQYEKMGRHDQSFAIGELSAWTSKSCLLYAKIVKAGGIITHEGVRWADGVAHVVDKGFTDPLGLTAEMATTATKVGVAAGKVVLMFLGDQEGLADKLKVRLDGLAERAQHMSKEELFRATVATGFDILGLCIVPEAGVIAGATAGMAVDASALATSLSTLKTAVLAQAEIAARMNPDQVVKFAPMVKAVEEVPKVIGVAAKEGPAATAKALTVVGENPQLVTGGESFAGAVREIAEEVREHSGTVWDSIKMTDGMYTGTKIPKSFVLTVGEQRFWFHPNATKHMRDYIVKAIDGSHSMPINSQSLLRSLKVAMEEAISQGIKCNEIFTVDCWEFKIGTARQPGLLPSVYHANYVPKGF